MMWEMRSPFPASTQRGTAKPGIILVRIFCTAAEIRTKKAQLALLPGRYFRQTCLVKLSVSVPLPSVAVYAETCVNIKLQEKTMFPCKS